MKFKFIFLANNVFYRLPEVLADELVSLDPDLDECPSSEFVENDTDLLRRFMTIFLLSFKTLWWLKSFHEYFTFFGNCVKSSKNTSIWFGFICCSNIHHLAVHTSNYFCFYVLCESFCLPSSQGKIIASWRIFGKWCDKCRISIFSHNDLTKISWNQFFNSKW